MSGSSRAWVWQRWRPGLLAWAGGVALAKLSETLIAELREAYVKAALNLPRSTVKQRVQEGAVTR